MMSTEHDILSPDNLRDPYPYFARMRQHAPVHWNENYRAWFVYRYDDVVGALRDPAFSSDRIRPAGDKLSDDDRASREPSYDILEHWMVFNDPPAHSRLRKLVQPAFTPRAVERMRPRVEQVVAETLRSLEGRTEFDYVRDFAFPIPAVVIAELMGVPVEDRDRFKAWSDDIVMLVFNAAGTADRRERAQAALVELADYMRALATLATRAEPDDTLVSRIVHSHEVDPPLSMEEVVSTLVLLLFGGHETTTNLLANGARALTRNPDQWELMKKEPSAVDGAVEEVLRLDGPAKMEVRRLVADVEMHGQHLRAGQIVYLVQASANRDESVFDRPDAMDITRHPNRHIGFGFGLHHCLGSFLARLEGQVVFRAVAEAFPDLEAVPGGDSWHPTLISRGMTEFKVRTSGVRL